MLAFAQVRFGQAQRVEKVRAIAVEWIAVYLAKLVATTAPAVDGATPTESATFARVPTVAPASTVKTSREICGVCRLRA